MSVWIGGRFQEDFIAQRCRGRKWRGRRWVQIGLSVMQVILISLYERLQVWYKFQPLYQWVGDP